MSFTFANPWGHLTRMTIPLEHYVIYYYCITIDL
jgi:hypothetical protein